MDLFALAAALVPVAIYMLILGSMHFRGRPYVLSGFADTMLLGLAVSGMVLIGPLDLFVPELAAFHFGWFFRVLLIALYLLILLLVAISRRPRIVIHNAQFDELRSTIVDIVSQLDDSSFWAGRSAYLPKRGLDFYVDPEPPTQTIQITSLARELNFTSWTALRRQLTSALAKQKIAPNVRATWLVGGGIAILLLTATLCARDFPAFAQSFHEWMIR